MKKTIKIGYIGSSDFSVPPLLSLNNDDNIELSCIITLPDRVSGRKNKLHPTPVKLEALKYGIHLIETENLKDDELIKDLINLNLDFFVVCSFSKMIPGRLLKMPAFFCINIHPSLLPLYRGAAPLNRVLMDGRTHTGITFFKMNKKLDSGKIIFQKKIEIKQDDDYISLSKSLADLSAQYITKTINNIYLDKYELLTQDHSISTYALPILKSECRISWSNPGISIHNQIRVLNGYLPAFTNYKNKRIQILRSENYLDFSTEKEPGTIIIKEKEKSIFVVCGDESMLLIKEIKPEGKKSMNCYDFFQGERSSGDKLKFINP